MARSSHYPIRTIVNHLKWCRSAVRRVVWQEHTGYRAMPRNPGGELVIVVREEPVYRRPRKGFRYDAIPKYSYAIRSSRQVIKPRRLLIPFASIGQHVVFRLSISQRQLLLPVGQ